MIAPAEFAHELVPHRDFIVARPPTGSEGPFDHRIVARAFVHAFHHLCIIKVQKRAALRVETPAEIWLIIRRQLAAGLKPDFVEHPAEMNQPA